MIPDTLRKAADLIDQHGWTTCADIDERGHLCALGGLKMAAGYEIELGEFTQWPVLVNHAESREDERLRADQVTAAVAVLTEYLKTHPKAWRRPYMAEWPASNAGYLTRFNDTDATSGGIDRAESQARVTGLLRTVANWLEFGAVAQAYRVVEEVADVFA